MNNVYENISFGGSVYILSVNFVVCLNEKYARV